MVILCNSGKGITNRDQGIVLVAVAGCVWPDPVTTRMADLSVYALQDTVLVFIK